MCRAEAQNKKEKESKRLHRQKGLLAFPKQTIGGPVITDTALPWSVPYPWVALQPSCGHGDAILPVNTAAGLLGGRALGLFRPGRGLAGMRGRGGGGGGGGVGGGRIGGGRRRIGGR
jgi:hypothetical protein